MHADVLETALERALVARVTTIDRLLRRFFELAGRGRPGIAALRTLLVERDPTLAPAESDLETLLFKILRDAGIPAPFASTKSWSPARPSFSMPRIRSG